MKKRSLENARRCKRSCAGGVTDNGLVFEITELNSNPGCVCYNILRKGMNLTWCYGLISETFISHMLFQSKYIFWLQITFKEAISLLKKVNHSITVETRGQEYRWISTYKNTVDLIFSRKSLKSLIPMATLIV